jgi:hypothetical protein
MHTSPIITVPQSAGLGQKSKLSPQQLALLVGAWETLILTAGEVVVQPWKLDNTGAVKNQTVLWSKYCADLQDGDYHQNVNTKEFGVRFMVIEDCVPDELPGSDNAWTMAVNYASSEDILYGGKDSASWMHVDTPIPMKTRITVRITATRPLSLYPCQMPPFISTPTILILSQVIRGSKTVLMMPFNTSTKDMVMLNDPNVSTLIPD